MILPQLVYSSWANLYELWLREVTTDESRSSDQHDQHKKPEKPETD